MISPLPETPIRGEGLRSISLSHFAFLILRPHFASILRLSSPVAMSVDSTDDCRRKERKTDLIRGEFTNFGESESFSPTNERGEPTIIRRNERGEPTIIRRNFGTSSPLFTADGRSEAENSIGEFPSEMAGIRFSRGIPDPDADDARRDASRYASRDASRDASCMPRER